MSGQDWRTAVDSGDYFLHRQKQTDLDSRRPVPRKASDLGLGPGVSANAVRITDYNDLLASFNGYFSSEPGAIDAPNSVEAFVGYVISDISLGGRQVFTGLTSGVEYSRTFNRSPEDPETLGWSAWSGQRIPASIQGYDLNLTTIPSGWTRVLEAPETKIIGDPEVYEASDAGIRVLRQGVYSGSFQVGTSLTAVEAVIYIYRPDGTQTINLGQSNVPMDATVHIPFTCWATDGEQGFSVAATHSEGADRDFFYRFSCTRIGDAI